MDFCSNCDNMYYIKLENEECDKIVYYCRNCGTIDDKLINVSYIIFLNLIFQIIIRFLHRLCVI